MKFAINMHTQILNKISSKYKGISESVLIIQNILLPGKRDDFDFTELKLHKFAGGHLFTQSLSGCRRKQSLDRY
jgi:hypothetical protein